MDLIPEMIYSKKDCKYCPMNQTCSLINLAVTR